MVPHRGGGGTALIREAVEWEADLAALTASRLGGDDVNWTRTVRAAASPDGRRAALVLLTSHGGGEELRAHVLSVDLDAAATAAPGEGLPEHAVAGPAWLNRHPSDLLGGGRWTCAGMSVVPDSSSNSGPGSGSGGGGGGRYVAYTAWHDPEASAEAGPGAVATTVLLPPAGAEGGGGIEMCDTDLPPRVLPSLLTGFVTPDPLSGGICLAGSTGCIADLRVAFPRAGRPDEAEVHSVSSHILSAYMAHGKPAESGDAIADAARGLEGLHVAPGSVPPSIFAASPEVLGLAVGSALMRLLAIRTSGQQGLQAGAANPNACIKALGTFIEHAFPSYVNFLIHAGIYLRVLPRHRIGLRDVGETIAYALSLVDRWRELCADEEEVAATTGGRPVDGGMSDSVTSALNDLLAAGPAAVIQTLPELLARLQGDVLGLGAATASSIALIDIFSSLLCSGHRACLRYRSDCSEDQFGVPVEGDRDCSAASSSPPLLAVYEEQLRRIEAASSSVDSPSEANGRGKGHVHDLSSALLDGYRQSSAAASQDPAFLTLYHGAKVLAIQLLRLYDSSDMLPYQLSLDHGYFEGCFDICHDWTLGERRFENPADAEDEETKHDASEGVGPFHLRPILGACADVATSIGEDGSYASYATLLPPSTDPPTGLTFPQYVLKRYADLGLLGTVLDLGRICPDDLAKFVEQDERMVDHRWIVRVRSGQYGSARDGLIDVVRDGPGAAGGRKPQTVAERELTLSLAKLCHGRDDSMSATTRRAQGRAVEDGLTLLSVQRLVAPSSSDERPIRPVELLNLVRDRAVGSASSDEAVQLCVAGLAVAEVATRSSGESAARFASPVWSIAILYDVDLWRSTAAEYAAGAGGNLGAGRGIDDALSGTVLFRVLELYLFGRMEDNGGDGAESDDGVALDYMRRKDIFEGLIAELRGSGVVSDQNRSAMEAIISATAGLALEGLS